MLLVAAPLSSSCLAPETTETQGPESNASCVQLKYAWALPTAYSATTANAGPGHGSGHGLRELMPACMLTIRRYLLLMQKTFQFINLVNGVRITRLKRQICFGTQEHSL